MKRILSHVMPTINLKSLDVNFGVNRPHRVHDVSLQSLLNDTSLSHLQAVHFLGLCWAVEECARCNATFCFDGCCDAQTSFYNVRWQLMNIPWLCTDCELVASEATLLVCRIVQMNLGLLSLQSGHRLLCVIVNCRSWPDKEDETGCNIAVKSFILTDWWVL